MRSPVGLDRESRLGWTDCRGRVGPVPGEPPRRTSERIGGDRAPDNRGYSTEVPL